MQISSATFLDDDERKHDTRLLYVSSKPADCFWAEECCKTIMAVTRLSTKDSQPSPLRSYILERGVVVTHCAVPRDSRGGARCSTTAVSGDRTFNISMAVEQNPFCEAETDRVIMYLQDRDSLDTDLFEVKAESVPGEMSVNSPFPDSARFYQALSGRVPWELPVSPGFPTSNAGTFLEMPASNKALAHLLDASMSIEPCLNDWFSVVSEQMRISEQELPKAWVRAFLDLSRHVAFPISFGDDFQGRIDSGQRLGEFLRALGFTAEEAMEFFADRLIVEAHPTGTVRKIPELVDISIGAVKGYLNEVDDAALKMRAHPLVRILGTDNVVENSGELSDQQLAIVRSAMMARKLIARANDREIKRQAGRTGAL